MRAVAGLSLILILPFTTIPCIHSLPLGCSSFLFSSPIPFLQTSNLAVFPQETLPLSLLRKSFMCKLATCAPSLPHAAHVGCHSPTFPTWPPSPPLPSGTGGGCGPLRSLVQFPVCLRSPVWPIHHQCCSASDLLSHCRLQDSKDPLPP